MVSFELSSLNLNDMLPLGKFAWFEFRVVVPMMK